MTTESRREFEEWAKSIGYAVERYGISDLYMGHSVPVAWEAWQAAKKQQDKELHEWKSNYKQLASHHNQHCTCNEIY